MLQLGSFILAASRASRYPHGAARILNHVADFFISSVAPGIPTVLIFSLFRCVVKLRQHGIEVLQTARIKAAAAVCTVAFDKTGTLTGSLVCSYSLLLSAVSAAAKSWETQSCTKALQQCCSMICHNRRWVQSAAVT